MSATGRYLVPEAAAWSSAIPQGIFRSAYLRVYPQVYIDDAFVRPSVATNSLSYDVWVTNASTTAQRFETGSFICANFIKKDCAVRPRLQRRLMPISPESRSENRL